MDDWKHCKKWNKEYRYILFLHGGHPVQISSNATQLLYPKSPVLDIAIIMIANELQILNDKKKQI